MNGLDIGCERKKGVKDNFKILGLISRKDGIVISYDEESWRLSKFGVGEDWGLDLYIWIWGIY